MLTSKEVIEILNLKPHPAEGGFFSETYRCDESLSRSALPERYLSERSFGTAIYYMLTPETFSMMHRLASDEIFHFYLGDPLEMLQLFPDGSGRLLTIGPDIAGGMHLQVTVPRGVWQGMRLVSGGKFGLVGTTVAPGFEFADYEEGARGELCLKFPEFKDKIISRTHERK